eukprot:scaffold157220_cov21-Tisochrysis_lutea.AAC.1
MLYLQDVAHTGSYFPHAACFSQDEGAFAIAEAISDNKLIIQLELGANKIGDKGATAIAKVGAFKQVTCETCCRSDMVR